ncbi:hypothetical protein B0T22DRAFT_481500 [Podospora appendiculata]|uniref:Uncharacterized protein n=1 Tax=Podospora appendiculata TaxID=314037 RepID=A0AAE0XD96_9PEZI|nr:hypothetical protein B0T22DRAFT_481500 [Podospora appendiculata]
MSWMGLNASLARSSRCLLSGGPIVPAGPAGALLRRRQPFRAATTVAKPNATKPAVPPAEDVVSIAKKAPSSKRAATAISIAERDRKRKADALAARKPVIVTSKKKKTAVKKEAIELEIAASTNPATPISIKPTPAAMTATETSIARFTGTQTFAPLARSPKPEEPNPVDISSPEFKRASRKYTSVMVALPILFVTSYYLFDRLALGNPQKDISELLKRPPGAPEAKFRFGTMLRLCLL